MSFLRRGGSRRGKARTAIVSVVALASFQVLAIIGAGSALAAGTCVFTLADSTIRIELGASDVSGVLIDDGTAPGLASAGSILFDNDGTLEVCSGSPTVSNVTTVQVTASPGATTELFYVYNQNGTPEQHFPSTITWFVDLGAGTGDIFEFFGGFDLDDTLVLTNTSFTMNDAPGTTAGIETYFAFGADGDDTFDGSALTSAVNVNAFGEGDDDWIAPGASGVAPTLPDVAFGGLGSDTLSYGTRTTSVHVDNGVDAGLDANGDGDNSDVGDEVDFIDCFETVETGSGNDSVVATCGPTTVVPGDGDDDITGDGNDWIDWSSSSAGMVIDIDNETATGQGTDDWTGVDQFVGSAFDDTMLVTTGAPGAGVSDFFGGDGVDTVDGSAGTTGQFINLDILDPSGDDDLENAIGGAGSDDIIGNDIRNSLFGMDGNDFLFGDGGNDVLDGGLGNDDFFGEDGADKVSYASNTVAGVNVDVVLGFATSSESGDDGFTDAIEIIQGSPFNDSITGGGGLTTTNFLFAGGNGKDNLTGSGSNDTLKGGKGNDRLRGLEGGDTLKGGKGKKDRGWGGPGVDFCTGVEIERGCE